MAHDIFISHSTIDKTFADAVCAKLEQRGIRCWIAPRDIVPSASWATSIAAAVHACEIVVLVFSAAALKSGEVEREITLAGSHRKAIIPMRIEAVDVDLTGGFEYLLPEFHSKIHWLDAMTEPIDGQLEQLAQKVINLLNTGVIEPGHDIPPPLFLSQSSKVPIILVSTIVCALLEILFHQFLAPGIIAGFVAIGYVIAAAILTTVYCMWLYESYKNLTALGIKHLSTSPAGAVASNFIPVLSLFRPMFVFLELMKKSGPANSSSNALLIVVWWLFRLADYAVWANAWYQALQSNFSTNLSIFHEIAWAYVPDLILSYWVVAVIDKRQDFQKRIKRTVKPHYVAGSKPR